MGYFPPEICAEANTEDAEMGRSSSTGAAATRARRDELQALRTEVVRLGSLVEHAVQLLRAGGQAAQATQPERQLGIPIELLRCSSRRDR